jgi:PAS domain S-box-containing protein
MIVSILYPPDRSAEWEDRPVKLSPNVFDLVLANMNESVIITDDQLDEPGPAILYVNPAFVRMTGYAAEEVLGRSPRLLQGLRTDRQVLDNLRTCLVQKREFRGTAINYRKSGEAFINGWYIVPVLCERRQLFMAVQRDLTQDERFAALAVATATNESAAFMLAGIRHELGNPINSIKAALSLLRDQVHVLPRERVDHYLEALLGEVGRIERLLRGLRTMNAFERPRPRWVSPALTVANVKNLAQPLLREHGIEWREELTSEIWAFIDADALHQILMNLVKNSIEAMSPQRGGILRVSFELEQRRLVVEDSGPGIPEDQRDTLFRPFLTTKPGGSGLGLYVARRLAADMECTIEVHSETGRGTRIAICFPPAGWQRRVAPAGPT